MIYKTSFGGFNLNKCFFLSMGPIFFMEKPFFFAVAAVTLDGFIARFSGHRVDWTSKEDNRHLHEIEDSADVLLLAGKTYEVARKELAKKNCLVLTRGVKKPAEKNKFLTYINPAKTSLKKFIEEKGYKDVCILGGRFAYSYCLEHDLIDEIFLTIEPVVFGAGIGMFNKHVPMKKFRLVSVKKLNKNGTLLLRYAKK